MNEEERKKHAACLRLIIPHSQEIMPRLQPKGDSSEGGNLLKDCV